MYVSVHRHKSLAPSKVRAKVITIFDTSDQETDKSGQATISILEENGHKVTEYDMVKDETDEFKTAVLSGYNDTKIGRIAMLSRAITGVKNETVIFLTLGLTAAVKLAMNLLIIPEIIHTVREVIRK